MAKAAKKATSNTRVVSGVGVAVSSQDDNLGAAIEKVMSDAINQALADGVTDPAEQKARMMAARDAVLKQSI